MASQHPSNAYSSGQAQMGREMQNQPSNIHNQDQGFIQETGTQVKNIAHGATEIGKGAVMGVASIARGTAQGASNIAQGTADAIKNTFGMGGPENTSAANHPSSTTHSSGLVDPNSVNITMDGSNYPNKPSYPHTPNL